MRKKRATKSEPIVIDTSTPQTERETTRQIIQDLLTLVDKMCWDYKTNKQSFHLRDRALFCFLALTGLRVSEARLIKKKHHLHLTKTREPGFNL